MMMDSSNLIPFGSIVERVLVIDVSLSNNRIFAPLAGYSYEVKVKEN